MKLVIIEGIGKVDTVKNIWVADTKFLLPEDM